MIFTELRSFSPELLGKLLAHLFGERLVEVDFKKEFNASLKEKAMVFRSYTNHFIILAKDSGDQKSETPRISVLFQLREVAEFILKAPPWNSKIPALKGIRIKWEKHKPKDVNRYITFYYKFNGDERELLIVRIIMI